MNKNLKRALFGKKVLVLGAGKSGLSAARFLHEHGCVVGIYDEKFVERSYLQSESGGDEKSGLHNIPAEVWGAKGKVFSVPEAIFVDSKQQIEFEKFDFCVISPGVSINHQIAKEFAEKGRLISEFAMGYAGLGCKPERIVAITGTNGKTSVTNMVASVLGKSGVACGNVGVPVTQVASDKKCRNKVNVIETSSFMLESPDRIEFGVDGDKKVAVNPKGVEVGIGAILNLEQDHLERHGTIQEYFGCKAKLIEKSKTMILNYDDPNCRLLAGNIKKTENKKEKRDVLFFSMKQSVRGVFLDNNNVVLNIYDVNREIPKHNPKVLFNIDELGDKKPHEIANILAVTLVCWCLKSPIKSIIEACRDFKNDSGRLQHVGEVNNIVFYNDSKATNIASCLASLKMFKTPVNLILGGQSKGQNFSKLFDKLPSNVDHGFCYGMDAGVILNGANEFGFTRITLCEDLASATRFASFHGTGPRVVLLSPACASLDQFQNYKHRGEVFVDVVNQIIVGKMASVHGDTPR